MGRTAESSQFRHRLVAQLAMTLVVATGCASTSEATSPTFSEQTTTTTAIDTSTTRASPRVIGPVEHSGGGSGSVRLAESEEHVFDVFQPPLRIAAQDSEWRVFEHNQQSLVVQGGEVSVMFYGLAERDSAETFDYLADEGQDDFDRLADRGAAPAQWTWADSGSSSINGAASEWREIQVDLSGLEEPWVSEAFFLSFSGASYVAVDDRIRFHAVPYGDLTFVVAVAWPTSAGANLPHEAALLLEGLTFQD